MLVLRLGIQSVFIKETTCSNTAPELFYSSLVFICLSLLAWATICLGYLIPFVFVAILLTHNGYFPNGELTSRRGVMGGRRTRIGNGRISGMVGEAMPNHLSNPSPDGTIDRLTVILPEEIPDSYQKECAICLMEYILCRAQGYRPAPRQPERIGRCHVVEADQTVRRSTGASFRRFLLRPLEPTDAPARQFYPACILDARLTRMIRSSLVLHLLLHVL